MYIHIYVYCITTEVKIARIPYSYVTLVVESQTEKKCISLNLSAPPSSARESDPRWAIGQSVHRSRSLLGR